MVQSQTEAAAAGLLTYEDEASCDEARKLLRHASITGPCLEYIIHMVVLMFGGGVGGKCLIPRKAFIM